MKSARKNHPWKRILIRRDAISEEKSSLREIFIRRDEISIAVQIAKPNGPFCGAERPQCGASGQPFPT